jgi:hypothetical protein
MLLHANERAILKIYFGFENRSMQLRMIETAAEATLPREHADAILCHLTVDIKSSMKFMDKLAHWVWGYTDEMKDALLIIHPSESVMRLSEALHSSIHRRHVIADMKGAPIYVLKEPDLDSNLRTLSEAHRRLVLAMSTVWKGNPPPGRAEWLQMLSNEPPIREAMLRLQASRKGSPEAQP